MKRLLTSGVICMAALTLSFGAEVMAQSLPDNLKRSPSTLRLDVPTPSTMPPIGSVIPKTAAPTDPPLEDLANHMGPFFDGRSVSVSLDSKKISLENLKTFIAVSNDLISLAPKGFRIDSGLSYQLPISKYCTPFASFNPVLTRFFACPQTAVAAGLHIPLTDGGPGGHCSALKFSASLDRHSRPIFSLTFNLMPSPKPKKNISWK